MQLRIEPRTSDAKAPEALARGHRIAMVNKADNGLTKCTMALDVTKYNPTTTPFISIHLTQ